jgi:hypothetical protein
MPDPQPPERSRRQARPATEPSPTCTPPQSIRPAESQQPVRLGRFRPCREVRSSASTDLETRGLGSNTPSTIAEGSIRRLPWPRLFAPTAKPDHQRVSKYRFSSRQVHESPSDAQRLGDRREAAHSSDRPGAGARRQILSEILSTYFGQISEGLRLKPLVLLSVWRIPLTPP